MSNGLDFEFLIDTFFIALSGVPVAMIITVISLLIALPLGFLLALTRINKMPILSQFSRVLLNQRHCQLG